jgi:hypothetical protein
MRCAEKMHLLQVTYDSLFDEAEIIRKERDALKADLEECQRQYKLLLEATFSLAAKVEVAKTILTGEPGRSTQDYRESISAPDNDNMFTLAYQWHDKKHRHIFDLCNRIEAALKEIDK